MKKRMMEEEEGCGKMSKKMKRGKKRKMGRGKGRK